MLIKEILENAPMFDLTGRIGKKDYVQYQLGKMTAKEIAFWIKNGEDAVPFKGEKIRIFPKEGIKYEY